MIIGYSNAGGGVALVTASAVFYYSSVISCNVTIPIQANAGDMLVAFIMHRDTMTIVPSGWTLVDTASAVSSVSPTGFQKISVYSKRALSGDANQTVQWGQATSGRSAGQCLVFRASGGLPVIVDHDNAHADSSSSFSFSTAVSTATADKQMGAMYATYSIAATSPLQTQMLLTLTGSTQETTNTMVDNRLCGGVVAMKSGDTTTGTISSNANNTNGGWAGASVVVGSGSWVDSVSISPSSDGSDYNGFTVRQVFSGAMLTMSGSLVRLLLQAGSFGGFSLDALYIGEQAASGDAYDMKSSAPTPGQFLFNGSGSVTVGAGTTSYTDTLAFAIDETKTYVINAHFSASSTIAVTNGTSVAAYQKSAVSEASVADVTGYTARPVGQALMIAKIQVAA